MLWARLKLRKNKKGLTLIEMVVAIAVTVILAVCLSYVILPVSNAYQYNKKRAELHDYSVRVMERIAADLRGALGVYVTSNRYSAPIQDYAGSVKDEGEWLDVEYAYLLYKEYWISGQYNVDPNSYVTKADCVIYDRGRDTRYFFPADLPYHDTFTYVEYDADKFDSRGVTTAGVTGGTYDVKFKTYRNPASVTNGIVVKDEKDKFDGFYFVVKENPQDSNRGNILEIHMTLEKGGITYTTVKSIVCENLVLKKKWIKTANLKQLENAKLKDGKKEKRYYSVWYSTRYY